MMTEKDIKILDKAIQHLCTSYCQIELAKQKKLKNEAIINSIQELKAQGIL